MILRSFKDSDRVAVIALWERCDLTRPWNDPDKDISRKLKVQPELFFVGEVDDNVVASAMAGYDGHRGAVYYLAVSPAYQGRGFGKLLMRHIEERLANIGCPKLNIQVRSSNKSVLAFYHSLGYSVEDTLNTAKRLIPDII